MRMYGSTAAKQPQQMEELCDQMGGLPTISADLQALSRNLASIGSPSDGVLLRDNIKNLRCQLKRKICEEQIRQSRQLDQNKNKSLVTEQQRSNAQQLHSYVTSLHQLMEEERTLIQRHPAPNSTAGHQLEETDWGDVPLLRGMAQFPSAVSATRAERDANALEELQRDITDLHVVKRDLTRIVQEQGVDVDVIEANTCVAHVRVDRAERALRDAKLLRRSSRCKKCCIVCVVVSIIIITLILIAVPVVLLVLFLS